MSLAMLQDNTMPPIAAKTSYPSSLATSTAALALTQTVLFAVPMIVLGRAIGWPASLRLPAEEVLTLIAAEADAVLIGYGAYLLVSIALIPLAFALRAWLNARGVSGWLVDATAFLGAAAGLFKTLGIVRWLTAMPLLAEEHARATEPAQREAIALTYRALNAYAGGVGELLGVQLLSGLWLIALGWLLARANQRWIGIAGAVCGLMFLLTALRIAFPAAAMLQSIAVPLALIWFVALSGVLLRDRRA